MVDWIYFKILKFMFNIQKYQIEYYLKYLSIKYFKNIRFEGKKRGFFRCEIYRVVVEVVQVVEGLGIDIGCKGQS